ncbi:CCA tRNA nucleotidyltransferase [Candidatus Woesearchaeota archaeon]|nr:CCA tRNA nucleotidyltransferase [Candidatus Woesearchaeota archaeon]
MEKVNEMLKKVVLEYLPTPEEENKIKLKIDEFITILNNSAKKSNFKIEITLGGSAAKGTFLKKDFDVDVFVRFDYGYKDKDLSEMLETILKTAIIPKNTSSLKITRLHGSRDYFQVKHKGIYYEIIPVLYVTEPKKAMNVTDMSPLHVAWLKTHLNENKKIRQEILLTKLFCKAQGCYGAESYIQGFSGHVLDILIVNYRSFLNLLNASQKWKQFDVIDVEKHGTSNRLNHSKISPLILIDPLQPDRNAAAALSAEKFELFKQKAKDFLANPSHGFFVKKDYSLGDLKKLKTKLASSRLIFLTVKALEGKEDIVGAKLLKSYTYILKSLQLNEFRVTTSGWKWDKAKKAEFWFVVKEYQLSDTTLRMGPPVKETRSVEAFKAKHPDAFVKDNRLYANVKRQFRTSEDLIYSLIKDEYVSEKVDGINLKLF